MKEDRWNVAVARPLTPAAQERKKRESKQQPLLKGLPVGEKLLYLSSVVVCVTLITTVISQYARATELSVHIQKTEQQIEKAQKVNLQLETEKKNLESAERIRQFAESKGLELKTPKILPSIQP
jgi:cell division protein FtsL